MQLNFRKTLVVAALGLAFAVPQAQATQLVTNGSFENGGDPYAWSLSSLGWSTDGDGVSFGPSSVWGGGYPYGDFAAGFGGSDIPGGSLWQNIATVAGTSYTLTFAYGAISDPNLQTMTVSVLNGGNR